MTTRLDDISADPEALLSAGTQELGLSLSPAALEQFLFYGKELLRWNARVNLTGLKNLPDVVIRHFLDSLAVWPWIKDLHSLADIGAGAGFPGLPLKLALPHLHLTLIESTGKKTVFLQYIIAHLGLVDVAVRQVHLTPALARQWGPSFQGVITRATFPLARYLELGAPLVKPGGQLIALKGPGLGEGEWQEAMAPAGKNACGFPARYEYELPLAGEKRWLVVWEKNEGVGRTF